MKNTTHSASRRCALALNTVALSKHLLSTMNIPSFRYIYRTKLQKVIFSTWELTHYTLRVSSQPLLFKQSEYIAALTFIDMPNRVEKDKLDISSLSLPKSTMITTSPLGASRADECAFHIQERLTVKTSPGRSPRLTLFRPVRDNDRLGNVPTIGIMLNIEGNALYPGRCCCYWCRIS